MTEQERETLINNTVTAIQNANNLLKDCSAANIIFEIEYDIKNINGGSSTRTSNIDRLTINSVKYMKDYTVNPPAQQ